MSLRIKITLTLVIISIIASASVGGIAEWVLRKDFRNAVLLEAFENFQEDITAYIGYYGSWDDASKAEVFHNFVIRRRSKENSEKNTASNSSLKRDQIHRDEFIDREINPPFQFLLISPGGKVLLKIKGYEIGETVSRRIIDKSLPLKVDGKVIAYAYPQGEPSLTKRDIIYLDAIRDALVIGVFFASIFSIITGLIFGQSLSIALTRLTRSLSTFGNMIEKTEMELDLESFRIPEKDSSRKGDEISKLAHTFNVMIERSARAHRKLKDESIRDPLTNLYNRRYFDQKSILLYELAVKSGYPLCVVLADLDYFKKINDQFSHGTGDMVLKKVAEIFTQNIRQMDIAARYGGEEFILLFHRTDLETAIVICERIREYIKNYDWSQIHKELKVTMSLGISDSLELRSVGKMIVEADKYLYMAKELGRNRVEYPGKNVVRKTFFRKLIGRG